MTYTPRELTTCKISHICRCAFKIDVIRNLAIFTENLSEAFQCSWWRCSHKLMFWKYGKIFLKTALLESISCKMACCWHIAKNKIQKLLFGKSLYAVLRTLGCLIQEGVVLIGIYNKLQYSHPLIVILTLYCLDFFPTTSHLIQTPKSIGFSKRCRKSNFISMQKGQLTSFAPD